MIGEIKTYSQIAECVEVLRQSFQTVANEFELTTSSAPTNPAFVTIERLLEYLNKPVRLFGMRGGGKLIGCVAIEKSKRESEVYYIERLAVMREQRHLGYGSVLVEYALSIIKEGGGKRASIGIMNNNSVLKNWYIKKGFEPTGYGKFENLPFEVCFMSKDV